MPHLQRQLAFLAEVDRLKSVLRKTKPIGESRRENAAEHSWHVVLSAVLLVEHANEKLDILKVVKMLLVHDVAEIEAGDTFHYHKDGTPDLGAREDAAAQRFFEQLPEQQGSELLALWREFEQRRTPEAHYAAAIDRFVAFLLNSGNNGGSLVEYGVTRHQLVEKNRHIRDGSVALWDATQEFIEKLSHLLPA